MELSGNSPVDGFAADSLHRHTYSRTAKVCLVEFCAVEVRASKAYITEVSAAEICTAEKRVSEVCLGEVCSGGVISTNQAPRQSFQSLPDSLDAAKPRGVVDLSPDTRRACPPTLDGNPSVAWCCDRSGYVREGKR